MRPGRFVPEASRGEPENKTRLARRAAHRYLAPVPRPSHLPSIRFASTALGDPLHLHTRQPDLRGERLLGAAGFTPNECLRKAGGFSVLSFRRA